MRREGMLLGQDKVDTVHTCARTAFVHSHDHGDDAQALCMQIVCMRCAEQHSYTHAHTMSFRIHTCYSFLFLSRYRP